MGEVRVMQILMALWDAKPKRPMGWLMAHIQAEKRKDWKMELGEEVVLQVASEIVVSEVVDEKPEWVRMTESLIANGFDLDVDKLTELAEGITDEEAVEGLVQMVNAGDMVRSPMAWVITCWGQKKWEGWRDEGDLEDAEEEVDGDDADTEIDGLKLELTNQESRFVAKIDELEARLMRFEEEVAVRERMIVEMRSRLLDMLKVIT